MTLTTEEGRSLANLAGRGYNKALSRLLGEIVDQGAVDSVLEIDSFAELATKFVGSSPSSTQQIAATNDIVVWREKGFRYQCVTSGEHLDYTGSGGLKWKVLPGPNGYDVKAFGAAGDGSTDDTATIQEAVDSVSDVFFSQGTYKVTASSTSVFDYGNTTIPVYRAIDVNKSKLTIRGIGAVIELYGQDNPEGGEINYVFSTDKNLVADTLHDITFDGLEFEFDPAGKTGSNYRSFHLVGVKALSITNCKLYSSGARAGSTLTLQNCRDVILDNLDYNNVTQGMNFSYVYDVIMSNINFDNFSEAIDFDRAVSRVVANNIRFVSNGAGQCWDMNSCQFMSITNLTAINALNVVLINVKNTTPPTYPDYVNNSAVGVYTPPKSISINGIKMDNCGRAAFPLYVGLAFNTNPGEVAQDIHFENINAWQSGGLHAEGCRNFTMSNSVWNEGYGTTAAGFGLIFLAKSAYLNNELSVSLHNVKVKDMMNAADAIRISAPSKAALSDIWIENFTQDGVEISSPEAGALLSLQGCSFLRTVDTVVTGVAVRFTSFPSDSVNVHWDNIRITQYTTPISAANAGGAFPKKIIPVGNLDTTGSTSQVVTLYQHGEKSAYFTQVEYSCAVTLAADATNYTTTAVRNTGTSVCSGSTTSGMTAGAMVSSGFAIPEAEALVEPGEVMYFEGTKAGSGQVIKGFAVHAHYLEFLKV